MTDDKLRIGIRCSAFSTRDAYHSSAVTDRLSELCGVYCAISHLSFVISFELQARMTSARVLSVADRIRIEAFKSLRVREPECPEKQAQTIALDLIRCIPKIRLLLRTDVEAAYEGDPASKSYEEIIVSYPCVEAIAIQRIAHALYLMELPLLPRIMTEWAHSRTGIDIHPGAQIGDYFFIDHGTGVVIGETSVIGNHVKLYQGVTLGALSVSREHDATSARQRKRHPNVEDWVTIYPNSTILGGETTIGSHSTIGANVFLMESVPPNSLVTNEKSQVKIVSKRDPTAPSNGAAEQRPDYEI